MGTDVRLPERRCRGGRWTAAGEPGPLRRALGWLNDRFGFVLSWLTWW